MSVWVRVHVLSGRYRIHVGMPSWKLGLTHKFQQDPVSRFVLTILANMLGLSCNAARLRAMLRGHGTISNGCVVSTTRVYDHCDQEAGRGKKHGTQASFLSSLLFPM